MAEPLIKVQATGFSELNKALNNKDTQRGIQQIGSAIAKLAVNLAKMLASIAKHQGTVKAFVGIVGGLIIFTKAVGWIKSFVLAIKATATAVAVLNGVIGPAGWIVLGITAVIAGLTALYKHNKKFRNFVNGIASATKKGFDKALYAVKKFFENAGKFFTGKLGWEKAIGKEISKVVNTIIKTFGKVVNTLKKIGKAAILAFVYALALPVGIGITIMKPLIKGITSAISKLWSQVKKVWQTAWNGLVAVASAIWKPISKPIQAGLRLIQSLISIGLKTITKLWQREVEFWGTIISTVWNTIKKVVSAGIKALETVISPVLKSISNVWNTTWNAISSFFGNIWNGISKTGKKIFDGIRDWMSDILDSISKKWSDVWNGLASTFSGIWDGIKSVAKSGWNAIIGFINTGVDGINSVIHFFGGKESTVPKLKKLARGTSANERNEFALVNDEVGAVYREAIVRSSGKVEIPKKRNQLVYLNRGDEVIPARKTAEIFNLNRYANGKKGWLSAAWDNVKNWAGDTFEAIEDALKDPLGVLMDLFHKGKNTATAIWKTIGDGAADYLPKAGVEWFKKQLEKLQDALTPANPSDSGVERWRPYVVKALDMLHLSSSLVGKVLKQIQTESRGNPHAKQPGADPDGDGSGPALGLMQTKRKTFDTYKLPGHGDLWNGFDDLLAGLNYAWHRYGDSLYYLGQGHGYANGGLISNHGVYEIAENDLPEYVIPTDISKRSRAYQLLGEVVTRFHNDNPNLEHNLQSVGNPDRQSDALNHKLDELLSMFRVLLRLSGDQVDAIKAQGSLDMQQLYKKEARDARMRQLGF